MLANINQDQFKDMIFNYEQGPEFKYKGDKPAIIDFYADWCSPCKMVAPVLEELDKEYEGNLDIYKVNVDENPDVSQAFQIQGIPAMLFVPMEGKPSMATGAAPKVELKKAIADLLGV